MFMKRLTARCVLADYQQIDLNESAIQYLTDSMANSLLIKIEYQGSGWRTVMPYAFSTSKDNNVCIMCYKEDSSIRSYRLDRITAIYVDDILFGEPSSDSEESNEETVIPEIQNNPDDYNIPYLPEYDKVLELSEQEEGTEEPFDDAIETLQETLDDDTDYIAEHQYVVEQEIPQPINGFAEDNLDMEQNNEIEQEQDD